MSLRLAFRVLRAPRVPLALVLAATLGCASVPAPNPARGSTAVGEQSLYRLTYDGGEGRTSLKVVLRRTLNQRFQIIFSDIAGRRVWSLDHSPERAILVDHRAARYCVSGPELVLPEVHPSELPLAAIPRVLAGRLPVARPIVVPLVDGKDEFVDGAGRRWRATRQTDDEAGALVAWSLLDDDGPALWWVRDRDGGILSRRGGDQYRWKLIVTESSSEPLRDIVPEDFERGTCDE